MMYTVHIYGKEIIPSQNSVALNSKEISGLKEIKYPIPSSPQYKEVLVRIVRPLNIKGVDNDWMRQIEPRGVRYEILKSY